MSCYAVVLFCTALVPLSSDPVGNGHLLGLRRNTCLPFAVLVRKPKRMHRELTVLNDGEDIKRLQDKFDSAGGVREVGLKKACTCESTSKLRSLDRPNATM